MNATKSATLALLAGAALAAAAADVCYEGRLLAASGAVRANETLSATLRAYETEDAATAFAEKGIEIATDGDGLFAATAAIDPPAGLGSFWIGVTPEGRDEIRPRMHVPPVPFSIVAAHAELLESVGPLALPGSTTVAELAPDASVTATNATIQGSATLRGDVQGAKNVYVRDLDPGDGRLSMLRTNSPGSISTEWDEFIGDSTLTVEPTRTHPRELGKRVIIAEDDGFAMVMIRTTVVKHSLSDLVYVKGYLSNGDFPINPGVTPIRSLPGISSILYTFPVRRGNSVSLTLEAVAALRESKARGEAKIKMVYFGAN